MATARVLKVDIEGQPITCDEADGDRLWHCDCPTFHRKLNERGEGYCPHTVVAIMRAIQEGSIEVKF
jgi:ferredoxin-thioredoxin reductase catalytic subunit